MTSTSRNQTARIFKDTVLFAVLFGLTNVAGYGFIALIGRTLNTVEYGVFNAMLGVLSLAGVFANSVQTAATQATMSQAEDGGTREILRATAPYALVSTVVCVAFLLCFRARLGASFVQIVLCAACLLAMPVGYAILGRLAARGRVRTQADFTLIGSLARLASGAIFLALGFGISGSIGGYVVNYLVIAAAALALSLRLERHHPQQAARAGNGVELNRATLATFLLTYATFTLDQFAIQSMDSAIGGQYATVSTLSKLVFFASVPIIATAYPRMLTTASPKARRALLLSCTSALLVVGLAVLGVLYAFHGELSRLFFGGKSLIRPTDLLLLALGALMFTLTVTAMNARIAWDLPPHQGVNWALLASALMLHGFRHADLRQVIENQFLVLLAQMLATWVALLRSAPSRRRAPQTHPQ